MERCRQQQRRRRCGRVSRHGSSRRAANRTIRAHAPCPHTNGGGRSTPSERRRCACLPLGKPWKSRLPKVVIPYASDRGLPTSRELCPPRPPRSHEVTPVCAHRAPCLKKRGYLAPSPPLPRGIPGSQTPAQAMVCVELWCSQREWYQNPRRKLPAQATAGTERKRGTATRGIGQAPATSVREGAQGRQGRHSQRVYDGHGGLLRELEAVVLPHAPRDVHDDHHVLRGRPPPSIPTGSLTHVVGTGQQRQDKAGRGHQSAFPREAPEPDATDLVDDSAPGWLRPGISKRRPRRKHAVQQLPKRTTRACSPRATGGDGIFRPRTTKESPPKEGLAEGATEAGRKNQRIRTRTWEK